MKFDIMVHGMKVSSFCVLLKECRLPQTEVVKFSSEDVETLRGHPDIMCVKAGRKGEFGGMDESRILYVDFLHHFRIQSRLG